MLEEETSVAVGGSGSYKGASKGSVYVEFDVPTNSLLQGGNKDWFTLLGPNASRNQINRVLEKGGELLPMIENLSEILVRK